MWANFRQSEAMLCSQECFNCLWQFAAVSILSGALWSRGSGHSVAVRCGWLSRTIQQVEFDMGFRAKLCRILPHEGTDSSYRCDRWHAVLFFGTVPNGTGRCAHFWESCAPCDCFCSRMRRIRVRFCGLKGPAIGRGPLRCGTPRLRSAGCQVARQGPDFRRRSVILRRCSNFLAQ